MGEYTIASSDESHYNRIYAYFEPVGSETASMMVTGLTTNCCIKILRSDDYIKVNDTKYYFENDYTSMNYSSFVGLLNEKTHGSGLLFRLDHCNRLDILMDMFFNPVINDASYNVRLLMGFHPFDVINIDKPMTIQTVGFMLSTPVLYLLSNVGMKAYMNNQRSKYTQNSKILMRINNSFSANYPINAGNADFVTTMASNDLTGVEFKLVDANMVEIELLSPMYLSVSIKMGDVDERLLGLTRGVAGSMIWSEENKNNDSNRKMAELKAYDVLSTMSTNNQFKLMTDHS